MAQTAAHLVDRVLPDVPWRQWVLTLPYPFRYRVAYDPRLQTLILRTYMQTLEGWQRRRGRQVGLTNPRWGGVTVIQRFGSALQLTPHFHTLGMDGVYDIGSTPNRARFYSLEPPTEDDVYQLVNRVRARVLSALARRGVLSIRDAAFLEPDVLSFDEPAMAVCYGDAIQGRLTFDEGTGQRLQRPRAFSEACEPRVPLSARSRGFDLHAGVALSAGDRLGLERLCRYIARPPIANDRLERLDDGRVSLRLKRPFSDGSTHVTFTPHAFIERLCALIPRPRTHRVRYHGLLAPASPFRRLVVPQSDDSSASIPLVETASSPQSHESSSNNLAIAQRRLRWVLWAELLRRVFDVDALECPKCHGRMRVIAGILESLGLDTEPPTIRPSRAPPEYELVEIDWT